ncbi:MAG: hypothetical protein QXQ50_09315 [Candidatus Bathyarchaeia archaeon]
MIREDLGTYYKTEIISLPETAEHETNLIPKDKQNPYAKYIIWHPIRIVAYTDTGKCFVYSELGEFLGELEKQDLKKLFSKIGRFLKLVK